MELQYNSITTMPYEGRNQVELLQEKEKRGYKSNSWQTYLQAKSLGLRVKRGEHGVKIYRFLLADATDEKNKISGGRRTYTVFSTDQLDKA